MTKEDIIRMAQEAGFRVNTTEAFLEELERFAALVVSAERDRIKQANAPEIERVNAHIKELEDAVKETLAQPEQHQDWCASLTRMFMSMPPKPAPCNCKPKLEQERFLVATIGNWGRVEWADGVFPSIGDKMYSAPPKWVGLTDEEVMELAFNFDVPSLVVRTVEAKLKEKNT